MTQGCSTLNIVPSLGQASLVVSPLLRNAARSRPYWGIEHLQALQGMTYHSQHCTRQHSLQQATQLCQGTHSTQLAQTAWEPLCRACCSVPDRGLGAPQADVESLNGELSELRAARAADRQAANSTVAGLRQELQASQEAEQAREEELDQLASAREAVQAELAGEMFGSTEAGGGKPA